MRRYAGVLIVAFFILGVVTMLSTTTVMADEVTIKGVVNEQKQIEADDDEFYAIDKNDLGEKVRALVGKKVEVTGTVDDVYGVGLTITVTSFKEIE